MCGAPLQHVLAHAFSQMPNITLCVLPQSLAPSNASSSSSGQQLTTLALLNSGVEAFLGGLNNRTRTALLASPKAVVALLAYHLILPPPVRQRL